MTIIKSLIYSLLSVLALVIGISAWTASDQLDRMRIENEMLAAENASLSAQVRRIGGELDAALADLERQAPLVRYVRANFPIDSLSEDQIDKAIEIAEHTPLDFEASLSLVKYADAYDIDYSLVLSIIEIESNFNRYLVGTSQDRGYMQIIPGTEKFLAERYGDELGLQYDPTRIFDPSYNLGLGIKYLDELIGAHGSHLDKILTEYNRGPIGLERYYAANQTYSTTYSRSVVSRAPKYTALNTPEAPDDRSGTGE